MFHGDTQVVARRCDFAEPMVLEKSGALHYNVVGVERAAERRRQHRVEVKWNSIRLTSFGEARAEPPDSIGPDRRDG